eukprot:TRINITY_DN2437_c0_g1_i5.p1 TRINITY_DN2437_c0_g1~~TRINITY_DN2437_c0_g1_i5.p1  ORF type:complete len:258 (+),score=-25.76 TRINITY_DN2437_c0_g1_i5:140-913(+)
MPSHPKSGHCSQHLSYSHNIIKFTLEFTNFPTMTTTSLSQHNIYNYSKPPQSNEDNYNHQQFILKISHNINNIVSYFQVQIYLTNYIKNPPTKPQNFISTMTTAQKIFQSSELILLLNEDICMHGTQIQINYTYTNIPQQVCHTCMCIFIVRNQETQPQYPKTSLGAITQIKTKVHTIHTFQYGQKYINTYKKRDQHIPNNWYYFLSYTQLRKYSRPKLKTKPKKQANFQLFFLNQKICMSKSQLKQSSDLSQIYIQ